MDKFIKTEKDNRTYWFDPKSGMVLLSERGYASLIGVHVRYVQMVRHIITCKATLDDPSHYLGDIVAVQKAYSTLMNKLGFVNHGGSPQFPRYLQPLVGTSFYIPETEEVGAKTNIYLLPDVTIALYNTLFISNNRVTPADSMSLIGMVQAVSLRSMLQELIGVNQPPSFTQEMGRGQIREQHRKEYSSTTRLLQTLGWKPGQICGLTRLAYREQLGMTTIEFRRLHSLPSEARIVDNLPADHIFIRNLILKKQSRVLPLIEGQKRQKEVSLQIAIDVIDDVTALISSDDKKYLS